MLKKLLLLLILSGINYTQSRLEISVQAGYSHPLLEAYGDNVIINSVENILIDGKRLIVSDNLGTNVGYNVQAFLKYSLTKNGHLKGMVSLGYNILYGIYPGMYGYDCGVRIQTFSVGTGLEVNPLGHNKIIYPSLFGQFRFNLMGGEAYFQAGLDFLTVTPRYGYISGINLNYRFKKTMAVYLGYSYSYDNAMNKQAYETYDVTRLDIPFKDKYSPANGLTHDRRVAYWSLNLGMNFFLK
jgi:hypothetical protein